MRKIHFKINPKYKEYLPSKRFGVALGVLVLIFLIILGINALTSRKKQPKSRSTNTQSINELLQTDTDLDGVFDWEEALWGTDKTQKSTYGMPDDIYIKQRKEELGIVDMTDSANLNETEQFAREFFGSYVALKSAGEDPFTINNFSYALGERIGDPNLIDVYQEKDIKALPNTNTEDIVTYYKSIQDVFEKYLPTGMGDEIDIVNTGLLAYTEGRQNVNYNRLAGISDAYKKFSADMMKLIVPSQYARDHLGMANNAYNTGVAIASMVKIINDPVVGLSGISQYQKYSNEFMEIAEKLENDLVKRIGE